MLVNRLTPNRNMLQMNTSIRDIVAGVHNLWGFYMHNTNRQHLTTVEPVPLHRIAYLVAEAQAPINEVNAAEQIMARAENLARMTVEVIRGTRDGAALSSVTKAINDQRLRIAYLEEVGVHLIR